MRFYLALFSILYQILYINLLCNCDFFRLQNDHKCNHLLSGAIINEVTQSPIGKVQVNLFNEKGDLLKTVFTDRSGRFDFGIVTCNEIYNIKAVSRFHKNTQKKLVISKKSEIHEFKIELISF